MSIRATIVATTLAGLFLLGIASGRNVEAPQIRSFEIPVNLSFHSGLNGVEFNVVLALTVELDNSVSAVTWTSEEVVTEGRYMGFLQNGEVRQEIFAVVRRWRIELPRDLSGESRGHPAQYDGKLLGPTTLTVTLRYRLGQDDPDEAESCYWLFYCTSEYSIRQQPDGMEITVTTYPRSLIAD
jgi:hypothetical protein